VLSDPFGFLQLSGPFTKQVKQSVRDAKQLKQSFCDAKQLKQSFCDASLVAWAWTNQS